MASANITGLNKFCTVGTIWWSLYKIFYSIVCHVQGVNQAKQAHVDSWLATIVNLSIFWWIYVWTAVVLALCVI